MKMATRVLFLILSFMCCSVCAQVSETVLPNPAYENIAPCPCDLTENQLDNNCCCDPLFTSDDALISACIPGRFGGNFTSSNENMCRSDQSYTPDWFPLTCIEFINTPDLGLYYYPAPEKLTIFPATDLYKYEPTFTTVQQCSQSNSTAGCALNINNNALVLPQNALGGHCIHNSPIQYLVDSTSSCDVTIDAALCAAGTILDAGMYTLGNITSINVTLQTVGAATNDPTYVKTNTGIEPLSSNSLFGRTAPSFPSSRVLLSPSAVSDICQNVVADVSYVFTWSNGAITNIQATITLIDVNFTTVGPTGASSNHVLSQKFSTTFVSANFSTSTQPRSGNPGYDFGLPVISGIDDGSGSVDTATSSQLRVWSPTSSGLCADATQTAPPFGYDVISGCALVFNFQDCTALRMLVEEEQRGILVNATLVSRFGNPDTAVSSGDWIPVLANLTEFNETTAIDGQCQGIPSRATIEFMWAKTGDINGEAIREIVGAKVSWIRETWEIPCASSTDTCTYNTYPIYSSVTFREIPAQTPVPLTTYELNRNDTCRKDATCWPELLLPIQPEFFFLFDTDTADTLRIYNYRWAAVVTFFSVAAALVPAHWSSIGRYLKQVLPL